MFLPSDITLYPGDSGDSVQALQERLAQRSLLSEMGISGSYDGPTEAAVKQFQSINGLTSDGVAGPATLRLLTDLGNLSSSSGGGAGEEGDEEPTEAEEKESELFDKFAHEELEQQKAQRLANEAVWGYDDDLSAEVGEQNQEAKLEEQQELEAAQQRENAELAEAMAEERAAQLEFTREGVQARTPMDELEDTPIIDKGEQEGKATEAEMSEQRGSSLEKQMQEERVAEQEAAQQPEPAQEHEPEPAREADADLGKEMQAEQAASAAQDIDSASDSGGEQNAEADIAKDAEAASQEQSQTIQKELQAEQQAAERELAHHAEEMSLEQEYAVFEQQDQAQQQTATADQEAEAAMEADKPAQLEVTQEGIQARTPMDELNDAMVVDAVEPPPLEEGMDREMGSTDFTPTGENLQAEPIQDVSPESEPAPELSPELAATEAQLDEPSRQQSREEGQHLHDGGVSEGREVAAAELGDLVPAMTPGMDRTRQQGIGV